MSDRLTSSSDDVILDAQHTNYPDLKWVEDMKPAHRHFVILVCIMTNRVSNAIINLLTGTAATRSACRLWGAGACSFISMGEGVRLRVTKSKTVDYVYIRYLGGFDTFEVEFGALVGTEYDVLDRIKPVPAQDLIKMITRRLFALDVVEPPSDANVTQFPTALAAAA